MRNINPVELIPFLVLTPWSCCTNSPQNFFGFPPPKRKTSRNARKIDFHAGYWVLFLLGRLIAAQPLLKQAPAPTNDLIILSIIVLYQIKFFPKRVTFVLAASWRLQGKSGVFSDWQYPKIQRDFIWLSFEIVMVIERHLSEQYAHRRAQAWHVFHGGLSAENSNLATSSVKYCLASGVSSSFLTCCIW